MNRFDVYQQNFSLNRKSVIQAISSICKKADKDFSGINGINCVSEEAEKSGFKSDLDYFISKTNNVQNPKKILHLFKKTYEDFNDLQDVIIKWQINRKNGTIQLMLGIS